jgi:hypothetical protein
MEHGALRVGRLVNKLLSFYGNRRFIIAFTRARYPSLSWATLIQCDSVTTFFLKIHFSVAIPSASSLPSGPVLSNQPFVLISHPPLALYMSRQFNPSSFDYLNNMWWWVKTIELLAEHFPPASCHFTLLRPGIFLSTHVSKQPHLCSTGHRSLLANTPRSYSWGIGFKYRRSRHRLSFQVFRVFFSSSKQMPR